MQPDLSSIQNKTNNPTPPYFSMFGVRWSGWVPHLASLLCEGRTCSQNTGRCPDHIPFSTMQRIEQGIRRVCLLRVSSKGEVKENEELSLRVRAPRGHLASLKVYQIWELMCPCDYTDGGKPLTQPSEYS